MKQIIVVMLVLVISLVTVAANTEVEVSFSAPVTVEDRLTSLEQRVTLLEKAVQEIKDLLQEINTKLSLWIKGDKYTDVCDAVATCQPTSPEGECMVDADCGTPKLLPNICSGGNVVAQTEVRSCITEHEPPMCEYYTGMDILETCKYGCKDAKCVQPTTSYTSGKELVFDYNKDGKMDCFKYKSFYRQYSSRFPVTLGYTPQGYEIQKYGASDVIVRNGQNEIMTPGTGCAI